MKRVISISILAGVLVTTSTALSPAFAEPFTHKECRDDPTTRAVVRNGRTYNCHNRVCCLTQACLNRTVPPTIEEVCSLKGLPPIVVPPPTIPPTRLPLQDRKGTIVPTPCPDSSTAC